MARSIPDAVKAGGGNLKETIVGELQNMAQQAGMDIESVVENLKSAGDPWTVWENLVT